LDCCLIAAGWTDPKMWLAGLEVALGLGFVIFVHELGHFAVAKICGVRVDKFFIGFDIAGLKLCSFRWGETVYGIGILPLGGYVKMLGQEDNPAQLRKEMERAKLEAASDPSAEAETSEAAEPISEAAEKALFDPRSYLAKSVPQRMAIISAGVIMNMIFAIVFATVAFLIGVKQTPTVVGGVMAGGAAWQAGILLDDKIEEVAGNKVDNWQHMTDEIHTRDLANGIQMRIQRPSLKGPLEIVVKPEQLFGLPTIGIIASSELKLNSEKDSLPFLPESPAAKAKVPFLPGDRIVKIGDDPIGTHGELQDYLVVHSNEDLAVTVARSKDANAKDPKAKDMERVQVHVPKNPMKHFGIIMEMGPVAAVQVDSPAARAGIKPGDVLKSVDDLPIDPMKLPDELHKKAGREVKLKILREGKELPLTVKLSLPARYVMSIIPDSPIALSELGAAYFVLNTVAGVEKGSPAAEIGLQAGDRLTKAKIIPPSPEQLKEFRKQYHNDDIDQNEVLHPFPENERNWTWFMSDVQDGLPGTTVEFTWKRGDKEMSGKAAPEEAKNWFDPQRGWLLEPMMFVQRAGSFTEALRLGTHETVSGALVVYRSLHSVSTNKISVRNLGGPWTIFRVALMKARQGLGTFLIFLTLLSANLAVINFLPIPVLDGGHIVLLLYEGIRGKPADERVQEVLTWIGLIFILSLMIFVFGLDFGWIPRPGAH
jgi:regulator of sigma E protease